MDSSFQINEGIDLFITITYEYKESNTIFTYYMSVDNIGAIFMVKMLPLPAILNMFM